MTAVKNDLQKEVIKMILKIKENEFKEIADSVIDTYIAGASMNLIGKMPVEEIEAAMNENKIVFREFTTLLLGALKENGDWYGN